ncbi:hypothetical protein IFM89_039047 [Coptis chinensis]|uniref:Uncharacterized protein n=1 Tax=Coptis chinensis TaxID=261450 RepID=A0A835H9P9_9MAGN|nr:hypothetical protein IFM89_039047 [Coptis chinensis]
MITETIARDAACKPVPLVQKPISSILEKIQQRKLEVSKKLSIMNNHVETNEFSRVVVLDLHPEQVCDDSLGEDKELAEEPLDEESKCVFRAPINDTQDLSDGFQTSDEEDLEDSPVEEVLAPSVLTMNLKLDSAPLDDMYDSEEPFDTLILFSLLCMDNGTVVAQFSYPVLAFRDTDRPNCSSDEEDYDKENIDPHACKASEEEVYPKGDPVKAFVDDEAEEKDDSDNDLMRFKENEEDEENEESEEFNDPIVSGYKEKPIDNAKRDQLHRMWLEQQDAAATDNVLQRLKCGGNQLREPSALEEEGDDEKEADGEDFDKDSMDDASTKCCVDKFKKIKADDVSDVH